VVVYDNIVYDNVEAEEELAAIYNVHIVRPNNKYILSCKVLSQHNNWNKTKTHIK
jgi:hypothetical protein